MKGLSNQSDLHVYSSIVPTIVGPKGVYTRPGVWEFLGNLS